MKMKMKSVNQTFSKGITILGLLLLVCNTSYGQVDNSYLNPPELIKNPTSDENYKAEKRKFTGIPSIAIAASGRMWAVWYAGITSEEDNNNYVVVATSDDGKNWEEVLVIDPDGSGPVRAFDPEIWMAPNGQLWVFWAQQVKPFNSSRSGVWAITTNNPKDEDPKWSNPQRLVDGVMMCKPVVLSTGEWSLPVSFWHLDKESAKMVVSVDNGETWQVRGAVDVPSKMKNIVDEHMIVERKDRSLWMLLRMANGLGESVSFDKGHTWSTFIPSRIQHTTARIFISRLNSGNLLLVKHGPIAVKTGRSHLMAFISKDDGHTWSNGLLLDERLGVSYPDGQQTNDGKIYITYDYDRRKEQHILMTNFTEADILNGTDVNLYNVFNQRRVISKGGVK